MSLQSDIEASLREAESGDPRSGSGVPPSLSGYMPGACFYRMGRFREVLCRIKSFLGVTPSHSDAPTSNGQ